jgi:protein-disulfide isomerase
MIELRRSSLVWILGTGALLVAAVTPGQTPSATPAATSAVGAASEQVIAYVGEKAITAADVETRAKARLFKARQEAYEAQVDAVKQMAFEIAQDQEAAKAGMSRDAYYKREVTDRAEEPTDQEVQQILTAYRSRLPKDDEAAKQEVRRALRNRNAAQRAETFRTQLLANFKVRIMIDPPRLPVPLEERDPKLGSPSAAVLLVEFSDFQCPYCQRAQATIRQLRDEYGDRLRFAFKQLPLGMHPQARLGAESALCAADQGKYWEARAWLFAHQGGVTVESVKGWAKEAGLDAARYGTCIDGHAHGKDVEADMATAESLAVSSAPAFFVNGRLLEGALPIQDFRDLIDDELARVAAKQPATQTR